VSELLKKSQPVTEKAVNITAKKIKVLLSLIFLPPEVKIFKKGVMIFNLNN